MNRKHPVWTQQEKDLLTKWFPVTGRIELGKLLGRKYYDINRQAYNMGLRKTKEHKSNMAKTLLETGKVYRYPKGHVPFNKGKKGIRVSPDTEFKKGHLPYNTKFDGYISKRSTKGRPYYYIRVSVGKWMLLHQKVWLDGGNEIPKGHVVVFKDGNSLNPRAENLECISRAELGNRNRDSRYPRELVQTLRTLNSLKRKIDGKENKSKRPKGSYV